MFDELNMYSSNADFAGIHLLVDPVDREKNCKSNVMAIFYEEQPFMWLFLKDIISEKLQNVNGDCDFLDVGCGSGFWSILVKHFYDAKVKALDKSQRAVEFTKNNARINCVDFPVSLEEYSLKSARPKSVKIVGIYPPYHIYPQSIEKYIPLHARGGSDGQDEFKHQLRIASSHLARNGIIIFNMMCFGDSKQPAFTNYYQRIMEKPVSLHYTNIFPPTISSSFLRTLYGRNFDDFIEPIIVKYPMLYYTTGYIIDDDMGEVVEHHHNIDLAGRSWTDRILLHQEINNHVRKK